MTRDPLSVVEQLSIAEELASLVRHDLRNRLGTIRNSTYFLKRRVERTELWGSEPRVPKFFAVIEEEIVAADAVVTSKLEVASLRPRAVLPLALAPCVELAREAMRVPAKIDVELADLWVAGDKDELALALRALLENAVEAGSNRVTVTATSRERTVQIVIEDDGHGFNFEEGTRPLFTSKPGRVGLGLNVALRVARRHEGTLTHVSPGERGARLVLEIPAADK